MSYLLSDALQVAIYETLSADSELAALVGGIFDAEHAGAPDLYVLLGPERMRDRPDASGSVATHDFRVSVVTTREGYRIAKTAAGRVTELLTSGALSLDRGRVIDLRLRDARARRDRRDDTRRVDLTFRARTEL